MVVYETVVVRLLFFILYFWTTIFGWIYFILFFVPSSPMVRYIFFLVFLVDFSTPVVLFCFRRFHFISIRVEIVRYWTDWIEIWIKFLFFWVFFLTQKKGCILLVQYLNFVKIIITNIMDLIFFYNCKNMEMK